jgi:predicted DNA-binding transcriptional regulator AlpA
MSKTIFRNLEELPISLNGDDVAAALNISRAGAYNLMNTEGFPTLKIGKRSIVPKEAFLRWIEQNTGKQVGA